MLEVGVGEGTNFELYPDNCSLTVLEYNENFEKKFTENVKKFSKINFEKFVVGLVEDMHEFEDNTFDAILCTHVLCSVSDVDEGLKEIKRVLKEVMSALLNDFICFDFSVCSGWPIFFYRARSLSTHLCGQRVLVNDSGFIRTDMEIRYGWMLFEEADMGVP